MKARLGILLGILLVLVTVGIINWEREVDHDSSWFFFEPRYEGKGLGYWLQHLHTYNQGRQINYIAQEAILHIGTNGLPLFLDWISKPTPNFYVPGQIEFQRRAVDGFAILGPIAKPAIPRLIKNLDRNGPYTMEALVFIGKDAVQPLADKLLETLADKHEPIMNWRARGCQKNFFHVQVSIIKGLGDMGTNAEAAIPAVKQALYANHPWGFREGEDPFSALVSIGQNHPEIVIPALLDALTNASAPVCNRGRIADAMGSFGTNHADIFLPALISTINDRRTDEGNRSSMARALAAIGIDQPDLVLPVLIEAFKNNRVEYQYPIADAISVLGSNALPALPILISASQSRNFYLRERAAIAVKRIAPDRTNSLARLLRELNNSEPGYRQQAIYALGSLGTNGLEAVPALIQCLSHPDTQTRLDATRALKDIGVTSDAFITALGENLSCTNEFTAGEAEGTLGGLAGRSKLAFVTLMKNGFSGHVSNNVRQQAKYLLINLSRDDPQFLLGCLDDADVVVRSGSLAVFYDLSHKVPDSIPKLRTMAAKDPDSGLRIRAADVLKLQLQ